MYSVGDRDRHPRVTHEAHAITHTASFLFQVPFFIRVHCPSRVWMEARVAVFSRIVTKLGVFIFEHKPGSLMCAWLVRCPPPREVLMLFVVRARSLCPPSSPSPDLLGWPSA